MSSPPGTSDLDTIIEDMTEAIARDPADTHAYFRRGNARSNKRQYVEAREDMQQVIALDPTNAMAHNNLGVANLCLGDFEAAAQNTSAAIDLDSEYRDAFHNRGSLVQRPGNWSLRSPTSIALSHWTRNTGPPTDIAASCIICSATPAHHTKTFSRPAN